jgi:hypothetical protein
MKTSTHPSTWRRPLLGMLGCVLVGLVFAVLNVTTISLSPPKLEWRQLSVAGAISHILVDAPSPTLPDRPPHSTITDRGATPQDFESLTKRARVMGSLMVSRPVVDRIGRRTGLPPDRIAATLRPPRDVPRALLEPTSEQRATQILGSDRPYRIEIQPRSGEPILDVYTQAESAAMARRLAAAVSPALRDYLRTLPAGRAPRQTELKVLRLGPPRGGVISSGAPSVAVLTFLVGFALSCCVLVLVTRLLPRRAPAAASSSRPESRQRLRPGLRGAAGPERTRPRLTRYAGGRAEDPGLGSMAADGDDWPRTTRVLPWLLAGFIAILWLVPFNDIQLNVSTPIDLKFDRLVLPFIIGTWLVAVAVGGRGAPRLRLTWIHAAIGAFAACAFLSVVLDAGNLNRTLEFDDTLKRLPLLVSYLSLFVMIASVVRPSEVPAFLKYILVLAVICALGMIWEYRFQYNPFYDLSHRLLSSGFQVGAPKTGYVDELGRQSVHGPATHGLEAVAMVSMALAIALVGLLQAKRWAPRIGYWVATGLLLAAVLTTYRKSAVLAPISVVVTLACFRPRQMLKLAPLAVVLLLAVHVIAPGAFGSTVSQLKPGVLTVPTVNERTADYDAIRPDLWSSPLLGRGFGSYDHTRYRVLDSEILQRLTETGVVGLLTYLLMMVAVVVTVRGVIRSRDPSRAPSALACAAAAASFLVVSTLFDVLSFPHAPYVFLCMAGLAAVILGSPVPEGTEYRACPSAGKPLPEPDGRTSAPGWRPQRPLATSPGNDPFSWARFPPP